MSDSPRDRFPDSEPSSDAGDSERIESAIADYLDRMISGEKIDPRDVLLDYPGTGHEILERLEDYLELGTTSGAAPHARVLGDYTLSHQIGRGGMGVVYVGPLPHGRGARSGSETLRPRRRHRGAAAVAVGAAGEESAEGADEGRGGDGGRPVGSHGRMVRVWTVGHRAEKNRRGLRSRSPRGGDDNIRGQIQPRSGDEEVVRTFLYFHWEPDSRHAAGTPRTLGHRQLAPPRGRGLAARGTRGRLAQEARRSLPPRTGASTSAARRRCEASGRPRARLG